MAMAQSAAKDMNGRQEDVVPCPAGPRKIRGESFGCPERVRNPENNTGPYTPLHIMMRQAVLCKGDLDVWGIIPRGTDAI